MAGQFGKTWWGKHWLHSLENVDYDNPQKLREVGSHHTK